MERIYTIPLRRKVIKSPKYKRSPKAIRIIKGFLKRHMKSDKVVLEKKINEKVWERGIKHPPGKIKIKAVKDESGKTTATLEE